MRLGDIASFYSRDPDIPLLSPFKVPRMEHLAVVFPADLKIVGMVGRNVCENPMLPECSDERNIEWFHAAPVSLQKIDSPCKDIPPRRHAGSGSHIVGIKGDIFLRKPV